MNLSTEYGREPNIFSDLIKPDLVPGESLSLSTKIDSVLEKYLSYIKDFVHQFPHLANKNSFFNNYTVGIFLFVTSIISLVVKTIVMYILCKHTKLKSLVTSLALQQIKEVGVEAKQEHVSTGQDIECTSKFNGT